MTSDPIDAAPPLMPTAGLCRAGRELARAPVPVGDTVLYCFVGELYDGQRMRPEKLAAWRALRRALRQLRRVEGRSRHPLDPGCLNHRDHRHAERGAAVPGACPIDG